MYNPNIDTTADLWDKLFLVRIPQLHSMTIDYMKTYGTYITGDKEIDNELSKQWMTTYLPIVKMVNYYREGVQIKIVNRDDIKTIYECISRHLIAWKDMLERGINIGDAPIDDLIAMDEFANDVYEYAKYNFRGGIIDSILATSLSNISVINAGNFFRNGSFMKNDDGIVRINHDDYPVRESLSDLLKNKLINLKRW